MSNEEELQARVDSLEESMRIVLRIMSRQSGMSEANSRALEALLAAVGGAPGVRTAVAESLEMDYSRQLAESENEISIEAFLAQAEVLQESTAKSQMRALMARCTP